MTDTSGNHSNASLPTFDRWDWSCCYHETSLMATAFRKYFGNDEFSDLIIRCGTREFKVHRIILCARSPFFAGAMRHGMTEAQTGIVELHTEEPDIVEKMLKFIYGDEYAEPRGSLACVNAVKVYAMATKYAIEGLQELAKAQFQACKYVIADELYGNAANDAAGEKNAEALAELKEGIEAVFTDKYGDTRGLRQAAAQMTGIWACNVSDVGVSIEEGGWIDNLPGLGLEMVKLHIGRKERQKRG